MKTNLAKLKKLLRGTDPHGIAQGVELALELDDPEVLAALLEGAIYAEQAVMAGEKYHSAVGRIIPGKILTGPIVRQHLLDTACARLVAKTDSAIKQEVRKLTINIGLHDQPQSPFEDLSWLRHFPNLHLVELRGNSIPASTIESLDSVAIKELHFAGYGQQHHRISSHPNLRVVRHQRLEFVKGGLWPDLRLVDAGSVKGIESLCAGAPELEELSCRGEREVVTASKLKVARLSGDLKIHDCPELRHLELVGTINLESVPNLKTLELGQTHGHSNRIVPGMHLAELTSLELLTVRPKHAITADETLSFPPHATLELDRVALRAKDFGDVGPLHGVEQIQLGGDGVRSLDAFRDAHDLRVIDLSRSKVTDLSPLAKLPNLRVVDVRNCEELTDISPLINTPMLQMVLIRDSGVSSIPVELSEIATEKETPSRGSGRLIYGQAPKATQPLPRPTSRPKTGGGEIPVAEEHRADWERVVHGLASQRLDVQMAATDEAVELGPVAIEHLLSKVSVVNNRLRVRKPLVANRRHEAPGLVARLLKAAPKDSKAAVTLRAIERLEVPTKTHGDYVRIEDVDAFTQLRCLSIPKARKLALPGLDKLQHLHTLIIGSKRAMQRDLDVLLPSSLRRLSASRVPIDWVLEQVQSSNVTDLALFDCSTFNAQFSVTSPMPVERLVAHSWLPIDPLDWPQLSELEVSYPRMLNGVDLTPFDKAKLTMTLRNEIPDDLEEGLVDLLEMVLPFSLDEWDEAPLSKAA